MKTNRSITASVIFFIFLFNFPLLSDCRTGSLFNDLSAKTFRQGLYSDLRYASVVLKNIEFEDKVPDDDAPVCWHLKNIHLHITGIHTLFEKSIARLQISIRNQSPRSPPII